MNLRSRLTAAAITTISLLISGVSLAAPANATTPTPSPSASGGTFTVCPGNTVDLDDAAGNPLPIADQQDLITAIKDYCSTLSAVPSHAFVQPDASRIGHLAAHIFVTPGLLTFYTTASSMPTGYSKTLECDYKIGPNVAGGLSGVSWTPCGKNSGSGSSLSTVTNQFCPVPGQLIEVLATLLYKNTFDESSAQAITE